MFNRPQSKQLIYLAFLIIPFVLFFGQSNAFKSLRFSLVNTLIAPIKFISSPLKEIKKIVYYHRTFDEYMKLKKEVDFLRSRLVALEEVDRENMRFEELLAFKRKLIYPTVSANVIGREPSYWNSSMIIDKGLKDGVQLGQAVVHAAGVVGKISEVSEQTSKVILVTDPQFSVAALVQRPRESGLVSGTLDDNCRIRYINAEANIQVGDNVITSKLSTSFPESLLIGEIIAVEENKKNGSLEGIIKPMVQLSQIEEVFVIQK